MKYAFVVINKKTKDIELFDMTKVSIEEILEKCPYENFSIEILPIYTAFNF